MAANSSGAGSATTADNTVLPVSDPSQYQDMSGVDDTVTGGDADASLAATQAYAATAQTGQENAISLIDGTEWETVDDAADDPII